jgi:hypothetical protein
VKLSLLQPVSFVTMSQATPKRVVLKCRDEYLQNPGAVIAVVAAFFDSQDLQTPEDHYTHICRELSSPSSLYVVLDLHCKEIPNVDLSELELQVFKIYKPNALYVILIIW